MSENGFQGFAQGHQHMGAVNPIVQLQTVAACQMGHNSASGTTVLNVYDPATGGLRPATQQDIDGLLAIALAYSEITSVNERRGIIGLAPIDFHPKKLK